MPASEPWANDAHRRGRRPLHPHSSTPASEDYVHVRAQRITQHHIILAAISDGAAAMINASWN